MMKALVIALLALIAAVVAGHFVAEDPGFIVIGYGGKVLRTTFAFFAFVLVISIIAIYALIRFASNLLQLRGRWRHWSSDHRRRRAHRALADGMVALGAGDFAKAEKLFLKATDGEQLPEAHYLGAADAAHAQKAYGRRDHYVQLATDLNPALSSALSLRQAQWAFERGDSEAATRLLAVHASADSPPEAAALRLEFELRRARHDAAGALAMIPALRRDRAISHDEASHHERECARQALLDVDNDLAALKALWTSLDKVLTTDAEVIAAYVQQLHRLGDDDTAEALLRKRLEKVWDSSLAALYGELECEPAAKQLRKLEAWSVTRGNDKGLRLARARQSIRAGLWGQARAQVEALMAEGASPMLHQLMAAILEGMNDPGAAQAERQQGLALATGIQLPVLSLTSGETGEED